MSEVLDRSTLDHLRTVLGDDSGQFAGRLIATFERQSVELMDGLDAAAHQGDVSQVNFFAHTLKGSSGSVGGRRLADLCAELEHWHGQSSELPSMLSAVRAELGALTEALAGYL